MGKFIKMFAVVIGISMLSACAIGPIAEGVITDKDSGEPIASASVTVNQFSALTNGFGHYVLNGFAPAGSIMMINAPGYNIHTRTVKHQREIVDVQLKKK